MSCDALQKESRALVRGGIPASMRSVVWKILIHQQVDNESVKVGPDYFSHIIDSTLFSKSCRLVKFLIWEIRLHSMMILPWKTQNYQKNRYWGDRGKDAARQVLLP